MAAVFFYVTIQLNKIERLGGSVKMKRKKIWLSLLSIVLALSLMGCGVAKEDTNAADARIERQSETEVTQGVQETDPEDTYDLMEVHFLDVGQGDCTLIQCGDKAMLIDTSTSDQGTAIQNYLSKNGVEKLEYLVLTHPDSDHIGSAAVIITKFDINTAFISNYEKDNKTYQKVIQALDNKKVEYFTPIPGEVYALGSAEFTILAPITTYNDPNDASIALLLKNGETTFLFTGDAEEKAEKDIVDSGRSIKADVYQVGHHGSKTSSSELFLDAVEPEFAVISCKEGNSYGFPHAKTLNEFRSRKIKVYRTDEQGTILAVSDGKEITWNASPSETWQSGEATKSSVSVTPEPEKGKVSEETTYILNTETKKFHLPDCKLVPENNREDTQKGREELIEEGYNPCKKCNP